MLQHTAKSTSNTPHLTNQIGEGNKKTEALLIGDMRSNVRSMYIG